MTFDGFYTIVQWFPTQLLKKTIPKKAGKHSAKLRFRGLGWPWDMMFDGFNAIVQWFPTPLLKKKRKKKAGKYTAKLRFRGLGWPWDMTSDGFNTTINIKWFPTQLLPKKIRLVDQCTIVVSLRNMSIKPNYVELTADVLEVMLININSMIVGRFFCDCTSGKVLLSGWARSTMAMLSGWFHLVVFW